jgi:hypothetical protein
LILGDTPPFTGGHGTLHTIPGISPPIAIEHARGDLSWEMCPAWGSLHLRRVQNRLLVTRLSVDSTKPVLMRSSGR